MKKLDLLYEGKAKKVYTTEDPDVLIVDYKDDATAFNGLKKGTIVGKGAINNRMTNFLFKKMEEKGVPTHLVEELSDRETAVKRVEIVPLEVIIRNVAAGSFSKKLAIRFGETIKAYDAAPDRNVSDLKFIPLVFAGWLRYLLAVDDEGRDFELSPDPMLSSVCPYVSVFKDKIGSGEEISEEETLKQLEPVLSDSKIFGVNLFDVGLASLVCKYFISMVKGKGAVRDTLKKYIY